ncbi:ADP-ribosylation factor protein 3 [Kickxella alabastrina]|uniref:ADP-ribosylation factor protein 3 n=1 Tax=Kickxella alabastrina TaxID=61397 RepID=A0ACC1IT04_9FUNG|nr:ADP-ribosylation factor protein 3 [Kickxella alabastrina]
MFSLVSGAYRYFTRQDEYNVLMLGLDSSGKTTLLEKIKHIHTGVPGMPAENILPTVGVNISKVTMNRDLIKFMDLGGQADLRGIWEAYFEDCHAILFVIDSANGERIDEAGDVLIKLIKSEELEGLPVLILANKCDLSDAGSLVKIKEMVNGVADLLDSRDVRVMEASGVEGTRVQTAMDWLHSRIIDNRTKRPPAASDI